MRRGRRVALPALGLVAAAVLLLGLFDCFATPLPDIQAMECCASMPCAPGNQSQECCKGMASEQAVYVVPSSTASAAPVLLAVSFAPLAILPPASPAEPPDVPLDVSTHAPPLEFYTLYHSLLI